MHACRKDTKDELLTRIVWQKRLFEACFLAANMFLHRVWEGTWNHAGIELAVQLADGSAEKIILPKLQDRLCAPQVDHDAVNLLALGAKEVVRGCFGLLESYCKEIGQTQANKNAGWNHPVRLLRNAFAHDQRWRWPSDIPVRVVYQGVDGNGVQKQLTLDKSVLEGKEVSFCDVPVSMVFMLVDDMLRFARTLQ